MTEEQKIAMVQQLTADVPAAEDAILAYLALSADKIRARVWPFGGAPDVLPSRYDLIQVQLTVRMIARMGGEGEISHSENGISRAYDSVDDLDILQQLVPNVGVSPV